MPGWILSDVTVDYGPDRALDVAALTIGGAQAVAVVGPSGAGKTTLLRILAGAQSPTSGSIRFDDTELVGLTERALRPVRCRMGLIHQDHGLVPNLGAHRNVLSGQAGRRGTLAGIAHVIAPGKDALAAVHALLEQLGIEDKLFSRVDQLSGGERQRVAIARALYQQPDALLADEPVASVDPARARHTLELLLSLAGDRRIPLVVSLHDLALARALFPRIIGLRHGRIVFDAEPDDLEESAFEELYSLDAAR